MEFAHEYEYWKPLETGESDSAVIQRLVPHATVHRPIMSCKQPVAPLLAARSEGKRVASAVEIAAAKPLSVRHLLVESFGGPFSPLNEDELQFELVRELDLPCVLVASSAVGAVGRSLQCLQALATQGIVPVGVVLVGESDAFAVEQIRRHWQREVVWSVQPPETWDQAGIARAAEAARETINGIRRALRAPETKPTGNADAVVRRDRESVWHPYTSLGDATAPLVCVGAQDEFLHLADGRMVIDAISSWWTILHGHRHPVLMAALVEASAKYDHVHFAGVTHPPAVELAELILQTLSWKGGKVFFSDNGSTAVEVALKMAYQFWCHRREKQRTRFISFEGGYHGDTFGSMAVGRDPLFFGRFEPLMFEASLVPLSSEELDAELSRFHDQVAAIIVEPLVQGAGGMRMHTPALLRDLAEVARRHDVLFIADEVMTGGGRTGSLSGASSRRDCAGLDLLRQDAGRRGVTPGGDAGRAASGRRVSNDRLE